MEEFAELDDECPPWCAGHEMIDGDRPREHRTEGISIPVVLSASRPRGMGPLPDVWGDEVVVQVRQSAGRSDVWIDIAPAEFGLNPWSVSLESARRVVDALHERLSNL